MKRREIGKQALTRKMKHREKQFDKLWSEIVKDVNDYVKKYGHSYEITNFSEAEKLIDSLCLSGAWIRDKLEGYTGPCGNNYKGSLTKKIRKALGYNI